MNYTVLPVVSELFEGVLLDISSDFFVTDDLKFGFKANFGCSNAIFALPAVLLITINCLSLFVKLVCLKIV
jgi:hypothetical protein